MSIYDRVFENNRRWAQGKQQDSDYFERLAAGQNPEILYIGCADSRVPANVIMGLEPGDVFVHRNVANLVVNTDLNVHSVIEYAVNILEVDHIVVCGHYGCGGVAAAMQSKDHGLLNGWLCEVRDVYRLHQEELRSIQDSAARARRLVELNVQEQCIRVMKSACVQKHYARRNYPIVHGWVFNLEDGHLKDLEIPFGDILDDLQAIYDLDTSD